MATYRIYHVESGGRLRLGETFSAKDDDDAVARARLALKNGAPAELWQAGRIVGRFSETQDFTRARG